MSDSMPQFGPEGMSSGGVQANSDDARPDQNPPEGDITATSAGTMAMASGADALESAPTLPAESVAADGITAWQNDKRITALWSINQNRNVYAGVAGLGWKKIANNSDTAVVALNMLAAHARVKGARVNFREDGGMIREMYVW